MFGRRNDHLAARIAFIVLTLAPAGASATLLPADARCLESRLLGQGRILRSDLRVLQRCVTAGIAGRSTRSACRGLLTPRRGIDTTDRRARRRIALHCSPPPSSALPAPCAQAAATGIAVPAVSDPAQESALCSSLSAHCTALDLVLAAIGGYQALPPNLAPSFFASALGGIDGNGFVACPSTRPPPSTTTSLSTPTTTTTSTTTTTTSTTTTTIAPTTTLPPQTTTTLVQVTTTLPTTTTSLSAATTTTLPVTAALIITEFMSNPASLSDSRGEYIEILNAASAPLNLLGLEISDAGGDTFEVTLPFMLDAGAYAVLARSLDAAGGNVDIVYASAITLANSEDEIILRYAGQELDRIEYNATWALVAGKAAVLDENSTSESLNDDRQAWCAAKEPLPGGDFGSPGRANAGCSGR